MFTAPDFEITKFNAVDVITLSEFCWSDLTPNDQCYIDVSWA